MKRATFFAACAALFSAGSAHAMDGSSYAVTCMSRGKTTAGKRNRRLHNLKALLERWVMMYPVHLRPTLLRRRLTTDQPDWWKHEEFDPLRVVLGGEPAADQLTQYLKPATVTLYARGEPCPLNEIVARQGLRTDPAGEVEVLEALVRLWCAMRVLPNEEGLRSHCADARQWKL